MKSLLALGIAAFVMAIVVGLLWMIGPELEVAEPIESESVGVAETGEPPARSYYELDPIVNNFKEAAESLPEFEAYQDYTREQFDRAVREFRHSSWPVTLERAQGFEGWDRDEVWELGVDRYGWYPGKPPSDRSREMMLERMLQDVRFEHYEDSLGPGALRDFGYTGGDR